MLEAAGVPFAPIDSSFDEDRAKADLAWLAPPELAMALAEGKAFGTAEIAGTDLILGSDQVLEAPDGAILGKPESPDDLKAQLARLSGKVHQLHCAAVIMEDGIIVWRTLQTSRMHMRALSAAFIDVYVAREWDRVRWGVGGYQIEAAGAQLFDRVDGCQFAVRGLPLLPLLGFLRERSIVPA